jgi:RNA polymerase sigma factor (sigma-70 family)
VRDIENNILALVYEKYSNTIYLYLLSLCHSPSLAEDLMQETFFKAMLSLSETEEGLLPWLYKVGKNLFIDCCRREKRNIFLEDMNFDIADDKIHILNSLITNERNRELYKEIQRLSLIEREVITLYYFGDLKQEQIANHLNLSHSAVRTLLHRTRKKLAKNLKEV